MSVTEVVALLGALATAAGVLTGWLAAKHKGRTDYATVALQGLNDLVDDLRAELDRREAAAREREEALRAELHRMSVAARSREEALLREVGRLRAAVRILGQTLMEQGVTPPPEVVALELGPEPDGPAVPPQRDAPPVS